MLHLINIFELKQLMTKYIFAFFILLSFQSMAQSSGDSSISQLVLSGIYSGKNIYVQNPSADIENTAYCTDSVVVNGKRCIINLNQSAFEIKLDSIIKVQGTNVTIIIYHKKTCKPKVLQSMAFPPPRSKVEFTSFEIDTTGRVHITTRNEPTGNRPSFQIDQLRGYAWRRVLTIPQKWSTENTYDTIIQLTAGVNTFRLSEMMYAESEKIITVESGIPEISCTIDSTMNWITCSDTVYFEIQTTSNLTFYKGYHKKIDISILQNGSYVLLYENKRMLFNIKRSKKKNK